MNIKLNKNPSAGTEADSDKMLIVTTSATILPNPMLAVCAMSENNVDVSKYGFVLDAETEYSKTYLVTIKDEIVKLVVDCSVYTIRIAGKRNIMVANRYKVSTQEQLDFLLVNGRAGVIFSSFGSSNETR